MVDAADRDRFELLDGDEVVGFIQYTRRPGQISFLHTEIDDEHEGEGLASELAAAALDTARDDGLAVLPFCPFVNSYIRRHPEYLDLVPEDRKAQFGL